MLSFNQFNIRNKLFIAFIVSSLIPLIITGWFVVKFEERNMINLYIRQAEGIATSSAHILTSYVNDIAKRIKLLQLNRVLITNLNQLEKSMSDKSSSDYQVATKNLDDILQKLQRTENVNNVFLTNKEGIIYYNANYAYSWKYLGKSLSEIGVGNIPFTNNDGYISNVFEDVVNGESYNILVTVPLTDLEHHYFGTIAVELPMIDYLHKMISITAQHVGKTTEIFLGKLTKEGILAASPLHLDYSTVLKAMANQSNLPMTKNQNYAVATDYAGHRAIFTWKSIPLLNLVLVVKTNEAEVYSPINKFRLYLFFIMILMVAFAILFAIYLSIFMTRPLSRFSDAIKNANREILIADVDSELLLRNDEIGVLANAFYEKGKELKSLHQKLLIIARQAGMSEVATSTLHNVGNILNSVKVSTELLKEITSKPHFKNLIAVIAMIKTHLDHISDFIAQDPKGKRLPEYLIALTEVLDKEFQEIKNEINKLTIHIKHIEDVIAVPQSMHNVSNFVEKIFLSDVINASLFMCEDLIKKNQIKIEKNLKASCFITVDQSKLQQILINLIRNACDAISENTDETRARVIQIKIKPPRDNNIRISISDTGVGIDKENLIKIFSLGFTTKSKGHGVGLHSSALFLKQMGGTLAVQSDGCGKGSTFTLTLPLKKRSRKDAHDETAG